MKYFVYLSFCPWFPVNNRYLTSLLVCECNYIFVKQRLYSYRIQTYPTDHSYRGLRLVGGIFFYPAKPLFLKIPLRLTVTSILLRSQHLFYESFLLGYLLLFFYRVFPRIIWQGSCCFLQYILSNSCLIESLHIVLTTLSFYKTSSILILSLRLVLSNHFKRLPFRRLQKFFSSLKAI